MKRKSRVVKLIGAAIALSVICGAASAQTYPNRAIRLVIPFAPGGIFDYVARLVSPKIGESLGQPVVVENRAGGGGQVGVAAVKNVAPDGYTVLLADPSFVINPSLHATSNYDIKDFTPVTVFTTSPLILTVHPKVAATDIKDFIRLAAVGNLTYGSAGIGTTPHIAAELFKARTKTNVLHVPFKGVGPAVSAVVAGQVDAVFGSVAGTAGFIKDGRLRALASTGEKRTSTLPNVPTVAEAGLQGCEVSVWSTVFLPKGAPADVISKLNAEFNKVLQDPEIRSGLAKAAIDPLGTSPQEASAFIQREFEKYAEVLKVAGIKAE